MAGRTCRAACWARLWMLAWMGASSAWQQRSIWTAENLFATAFYGGSAIGPGFGRGTVSGLALYLLLYSLLGAAFAAVVRGRLPRGKMLLAARAVRRGVVLRVVPLAVEDSYAAGVPSPLRAADFPGPLDLRDLSGTVSDLPGAGPHRGARGGYRSTAGRTPRGTVRYASSNSIFFAAGSSLTMRKPRIWPARAGSRPAGPPDCPPFHLAASMELSDERSALDSAGLSSGSAVSAGTRQAA